MNSLQAMQWVLGTPGLTMVVGKDGHVTLIYGISFEVSADNLIDAVIALQEAQVAKDNIGEGGTCST